MATVLLWMTITTTIQIRHFDRYELAENQQVQDCNSNEEKEKNEPIGVITKELSEDYNLG